MRRLPERVRRQIVGFVAGTVLAVAPLATGASGQDPSHSAASATVRSISFNVNTWQGRATELDAAARSLMSIKWNTSVRDRGFIYDRARNALNQASSFLGGTYYAQYSRRLENGIRTGNLVDSSKVLTGTASLIVQYVDTILAVERRNQGRW